MATRKLTKSQWKDYFDAVSRHMGGRQVEIEVVGSGLGDQIEVEWTPLRGLAYDPDDDVMEVVTDDMDHLIPHPRSIHVNDDADGLHNLEVIDADGNKQLVLLKTPLKLPPTRH